MYLSRIWNSCFYFEQEFMLCSAYCIPSDSTILQFISGFLFGDDSRVSKIQKMEKIAQNSTFQTIIHTDRLNDGELRKIKRSWMDVMWRNWNIFKSCPGKNKTYFSVVLCLCIARIAINNSFQSSFVECSTSYSAKQLHGKRCHCLCCLPSFGIRCKSKTQQHGIQMIVAYVKFTFAKWQLMLG